MNVIGLLVDAGPLVAIVSSRDQYHTVCTEELRRLQTPLFTCWPVVTEAVWLLREEPDSIDRLLGGLAEGFFQLLVLEGTAVPWIREFLRRYRSIGAQLADAALVYLAEREGIETVFTLDRRDFSVYRLRGNRSLKLLPHI